VEFTAQLRHSSACWLKLHLHLADLPQCFRVLNVMIIVAHNGMIIMIMIMVTVTLPLRFDKVNNIRCRWSTCRSMTVLGELLPVLVLL